VGALVASSCAIFKGLNEIAHSSLHADRKKLDAYESGTGLFPDTESASIFMLDLLVNKTLR
jgi:hypothetical protein